MLLSPPTSSIALPPSFPPSNSRPLSMISSSQSQPRTWTSRIKPGQVVAFSVSLDGLSELFLDNPALVGTLRRMQFKTYLGVVHEASIYDPLGVVADGLHRFSRPPPEDFTVTLLGPGPIPDVPCVGIPIDSNSSSTVSSKSSSLHLLDPVPLPYNPAFAYIHKPIRLISHDVHASRGSSDCLGLSLRSESQSRLAEAVWQTAGSWEGLVPTSGSDVSLDKPISLSSVNVLVDVWTDFDPSCTFADPSSLWSELAEVQEAIARFYLPSCSTGSASEGQESAPQSSISENQAPSETGAIYVLGLGAVITAGVFWTRYFRR